MKNGAGHLLVTGVSVLLSFVAIAQAAAAVTGVGGVASANLFTDLGNLFQDLSLAHKACVIGFSAGSLILLIGQLLFLASAFGESLWWGLSCLAIPVIPFVAFLFARWEYARGAYLVILLGGAVMAGSALIGLLAF